MTAVATVDDRTRVAVLLTGVAGVGALAASHLLLPAVALAVAVLLVGAAAAPAVGPLVGSAGARRTRAALGLVALVAGAGAALAPGVIGTRVALVTCGTLLLQQVLADTPRELRTTLLLGGGATLLSVGLAPGVAVVGPLVVAWVAGLVAVTGIRSAAESVLPRATVAGTPGAGPAPVRRLLPVVGLTVAVALLAVLLVPRSEGLEAARSALGAAAGGGPQPSGSRVTAAYDGTGPLDLRARGRLPETPVAAVDPTSPLLWRAVVMGNYDGAAWYPARATDTVRVTSDVPDVLDAGLSTGESREDAVLLLEGYRYGALLAAGRPVRVDVPGGVLVGDGGSVTSAEGVIGPGSTYAVTSEVLPRVEDVASSGPGTRTDGSDVETDARWTTVPTSVTARTRDLAATVVADAGATTPAEQVLAVQEYLRSTYTYDLDSPVPSFRTDAVDDFLFTSRRGFCEQFASAGVVMLRSLGVPARMVTGFSTGQDSDGRRVFRSSDAHAWVEAWVPGSGWVTADPTASESSQSVPQRISALIVRAFTDTTWRRVLAGAIVVLGGLVVLVLRLRRRRAAVPARAADLRSGPTPELVAAVERLDAALAAAGRARPPAETVVELAARLPEAAPALSVVDRASYGADPVPTAETLDAVARLDRVTARVLATTASS